MDTLIEIALLLERIPHDIRYIKQLEQKTATELAVDLGTTRRTLYRWEKGLCRPNTTQALAILIHADRLRGYGPLSQQ